MKVSRSVKATVVTSILALVTLIAISCAHNVTTAADNTIPDNPDWNWDVRPILSQNCFQCHGQGAQKAGVRLDVASGAYAEIAEDKGHHPIVPYNVNKSEIYKRITSTNVDFRMPPKEAHKNISQHDIAVIKRWIEKGAVYKKHWSYITPVKVNPEHTNFDKLAKNDIDRYVYSRMVKEGLQPSTEADRETLVNRLYLDLTGLPPTLNEVDEFVNDKSDNAYEKLVDKLLASDAYAERQTNIWLDMARYADTRGGLNDGERPISYPYRDWVITAFKQNMPYDQFVTWQLAGDKLNNNHPTRDQLLATAFLKAGRQDSEGGSIDEEFRMNYVEERTELIGKDFLGLTVGCAKCHDHKYDVIAKSDYYALAGIFNQMDERGSGSGSRGTPQGTTLEWPTPGQSKRLSAAHNQVIEKQKAYELALSHAKTHTNKLSFADIDSYIKKDTIAYYPLDNGYKGDFDSLYVDPQSPPLGEPVPGKTNELDKLTRSQATIYLQNKILDDIHAGKPTPMLVAPTPAVMKNDKPKGDDKKKSSPFGRRSQMANDMLALSADKDLPILASQRVDWSLEQLLASGYTDERLGDPQRITKRQLQQWVNADKLLYTDSGLKDGKKAFISNVTFVPGHKGQGIKLHDSVFSIDKSIGQFERTQPYSLDFWLKLPEKKYFDSTRPRGPSASILYNNGAIEGLGYELSMSNNKMSYAITHNAPSEMLLITTVKDVPVNKWIHVTSTYDGNSRAEGMSIYFDGVKQDVEIEHNHLTRSTRPNGVDSQFGSYFGLASGVNFNRPELVDGSLDEVRVITHALTPSEILFLQDVKDPSQYKSLKDDMITMQANSDQEVQKAWQELTDARINEQRVDTGIRRIMVAGDQQIPRKSYVLDRGVYNSWQKEIEPGALPQVFEWKPSYSRDRLGLSQWLFDPKNPLTARVFVNRLWQQHFGTGIVQTVDDFGTQGTNPTNIQLLDYLAEEFIESGYNIKHMQKLIVMSATYRQVSTISRDALEKDPNNFYLEHGPRYRLPAEIIRDNALKASGLLIEKVGGDSVFPYAPGDIWDGVAQGEVVYPTNVPADQMYRRSMYTYVKRNAPVANLVPFDMPDRRDAQTNRPVSNTPLQGLVLLNDVQFMEAYKKIAEKAEKSSTNTDQQLVTLYRLTARHHPDDKQLNILKDNYNKQLDYMNKNPESASKIINNGYSKVDENIDKRRLAAFVIIASVLMNTPSSYMQH